MRARLLSVLAFSWMLSGPALGATLTLEGAAGEPGLAGLPGEAGGEGDPGESLLVNLDGPDAENLADLIGGLGGAGGAGGPALGLGEQPGSGGDGGSGGGAVATVEAQSTASPVRADAVTLGGTGGRGSEPGSANGVLIGAAGAGGSGGSAVATATAVSSQAATAGAFATGGDGGDGGIGGDGGDATAHADSTAGMNEDSWASATAEGGQGGLPITLGGQSGAGGEASASARAIASGTGEALAMVEASGGAGGDSDFTLTGIGGDAVLQNAVSGSSGGGGRLSLSQSAYGGSGGPAGGDAVSELFGENPGGGDLHVGSFASGGEAWSPGGRGGDTRVSAVGIDRSGSAISVYAIAVQGNSGFALDAVLGVVSLGPIYGQSTAGGNVWVSGSLDAESPEMINAVDGDTTGDLVLVQSADAFPTRLAASGSVRSVLQKVSDARSLDLRTSAHVSRSPYFGPPFSGRSAEAMSEAEGSGEIVRAFADATGGGGGPAFFAAPPEPNDADDPVIDPPIGLRGGNAHALARAHSTGSALETSATSRAASGNYGGDAFSESYATADRAGAVAARSMAVVDDGIGHAEATSLAIGAGPARVASVADARSRTCVSPICGTAGAAAESRGVREATSFATTQGLAAFSADARASSHDFVRGARATSWVEARRDVDGLAQGWSAIHAEWEGRGISNWSRVQRAVALGHPEAADVDAWLSDGSQAAMTARDAREVFALGSIGAGRENPEADGEVEFSLDRSALGDDSIFLAFLAPDALAGGFETLDLGVVVDGVEILDLHWTDLASADEFFGETVLELLVEGAELDELMDVLISLHVVLDGVEQQFFADFALFTVPEARIAALLFFALLALALRRRRRAAILET